MHDNQNQNIIVANVIILVYNLKTNTNGSFLITNKYMFVSSTILFESVLHYKKL